VVTEIILHFGWRAAFWFSATVEAFIAMVWYRAAHDAPEKYPLIPAAELKPLQEGREEENKTAAGKREPCHGPGYSAAKRCLLLLRATSLAAM
jgi:MFS transporter, ACS family, glucarate transporter